MTTGTVINIKRFEIHDGDGIRTTLFLKGCPLRCRWCHNPEGLTREPEIGYYAHKCIGCGECAAVCPTGSHLFREGKHLYVRESCHACGACVKVCLGDALVAYGRVVTPEEILPKLMEDIDFFRNSGGGVTLSGGEPLLQAEFSAELLKLLKEKGVNTAVDTCLYAPRESLDAVLPYTDTFLVDVKAMDSSLHKELTGVENRKILDNIRYLDAKGKKMEIRIPYIPGLNDGEMGAIASFLAELKNIVRVKVLPYHDYAVSKYESLGKPYPTDAALPSREECDAARELLRRAGLTVAPDPHEA